MAKIVRELSAAPLSCAGVGDTFPDNPPVGQLSPATPPGFFCRRGSRAQDVAREVPKLWYFCNTHPKSLLCPRFRLCSKRGCTYVSRTVTLLHSDAGSGSLWRGLCFKKHRPGRQAVNYERML